jgi:hypothetical protein
MALAAERIITRLRGAAIDCDPYVISTTLSLKSLTETCRGSITIAARRNQWSKYGGNCDAKYEG